MIGFAPFQQGEWRRTIERRLWCRQPNPRCVAVTDLPNHAIQTRDRAVPIVELRCREDISPPRILPSDDPAVDSAEARGIPTLGNTVEDCMPANPKLSNWIKEFYCFEATATESALAQLQPMD